MRKNLLIQLVLLLAMAGTVAVHAADADPTVQQIYEAARTGQLQQAQQMMDQVLRDHPQSGRAHYVQAELYARERNFPAARMELSRAEQLEPGLPFARPAAVGELQREISGAGAVPGARYGAGHPFPWGIVLLVAAVFGVILFLVRRRSAAYASYPGYPQAGYPQPGYPSPAPMPGPIGMPGSYGGGSGLMGNLATGLAVGAGVAAGEELVHHLTGNSGVGGGVIAAASSEELPPPPANSDMGGTDFGISDGGSSWDDGGSFGGDGGGDMGGGGGDWT
jgi:uncharacterized membrane protein YgcG